MNAARGKSSSFIPNRISSGDDLSTLRNKATLNFDLVALAISSLRSDLERSLVDVSTTIVSLSSANPTASVGLTAVNGSATTYMRSDAAPPLNQGISPTWTGSHTFALGVSMQSTLAVAGVLTASSRVNIGGATDNATFALNVAGGSIALSGSNTILSYGSGNPGDANYERMSMVHTGSAAELRSQASGTGTVEPLRLVVGSTTRYEITNAGAHIVTGAVSMSSTLGVTGNLTNSTLAGTGTRLVASTSAGLLVNTSTIAGNYTFSGTISASNLSGTNTGDQTITLTGDVTGSGTGSFATTIANGAVTNAKIADVAWSKITGGPSGSANQVAVFSGASTIAGASNLTFDGSTLSVTGAIIASGSVQASGEFFSPSSGGGYWIGASGSYDGTGMGYSAGPGNLTFWNNGAVALSIASSGAAAFGYAVTMASTAFVGGTGTPARQLEVSGTSSEVGIRINSDDGDTPLLELTDGGSTTPGEFWRIYKDPASHQLDFNNGAQRMFISAAGAVGIPGTLTVYGAASADTIALGGGAAFDYDEGTFTATLTGVSGTVTGTARYVRFGKAVVLYIPQMDGTSNTTDLTITGMPTGIRPARVQYPLIDGIRDNSGTDYAGFIEIATSGVMTVWRRTSASGGSTALFTNSGTKGFWAPQVIAYNLV